MFIKQKSCFKDPASDHTYFRNWVKQLEKANHRKYEEYEISTQLGKTHVWGLNTKETDIDTLVIFPGARTTSLFWDFDRGLDHLHHKLRIFMVETNGLPNLSDGATPDIRSLDYGIWASEVLDGLRLESAFVAGASFGGLICMKLAVVNPSKIRAAFLLNPGCLQAFSLKFKNLYYNLLPIMRPTTGNVKLFLDKAVFSKPEHHLSPTSEKLIIDYELFAISRYKDKTQKPYYMDRQLSEGKADTYLLLGDKDLLFPVQRSADNARKHLKHLKDIKIFNNVGHGIETYDKAMKYIGSTIKTMSCQIAEKQ